MLVINVHNPGPNSVHFHQEGDTKKLLEEIKTLKWENSQYQRVNKEQEETIKALDCLAQSFKDELDRLKVTEVPVNTERLTGGG